MINFSAFRCPELTMEDIAFYVAIKVYVYATNK